ncbi:MAG: ribosome assembly cofactor RimP [Dysgonamonadaceae bacterium]|jgi:ribosome maturation factor RimP|nr:ribosome assembly cofactor RimP [Dysgonamonadaceae bacterium]
MDKALIAEIAGNYLKDSDKYLVDVKLEPGDRIVVEIDGDTPVSIDDCIALTKHIESVCDRDVEDYELEVGSAGISQPFKILRQYQKAVGREVEILLKTGKKQAGILKATDENAIVLTVQKQVKPEGAKRKTTVEEDLSFGYNEIKYTKYIIKLK